MALSPEFQEVRTPDAAKAYAKVTIRTFGWAAKQWGCLEELWTRESNWRPDAQNKISVKQNGKHLKAGGIPQILGLNPKTSVFQQVNKGLIYINSRYENPCHALNFHNKHNWY